MTRLLQLIEDAKAQGWGDWVRSEADEKALLAGYYFDINAADRVRQFCQKFLRHSKGEWAGKPFVLLDWQWQDLVGPLFGWKRPDGTRRYRRGYIEVPKKNGKALALDTPLPKPGGWTTIGNVQPGDQLLDEQGNPCTVTATSGIMHDRPCYEVVFSDGTSLIADADHEWVTLTQEPEGVVGVHTTAEIYATLITSTGEPNHSIPFEPVEH